MVCGVWHVGGYGIRTDNLPVSDIDRVKTLIHLAPNYERYVAAHFSREGISEPTLKDYLEVDTIFGDGVAEILTGVIRETEQVSFDHCQDSRHRVYLIYPPAFPWQMQKNDATLTEGKIAAILKKYVAVITDVPVDACYQDIVVGD